MRVEDSLERGVSYFYAEVQRLKAVLDVAVENYSKSPIKMGVDVVGLGPMQQQPSVAAKATQHFFFTDPTGGPGTCGPITLGKDYVIQITDMGSNTFTHHALMKRTGCSHTEKWVRPWDQSYSTSSIEDYQQHYLYIFSVTPSPNQTCDSKGKYKVAINNNSPTAQTFRVVAKAGGVVYGEVKDISLGKNKSTTVELSFNYWASSATFYIEGASGNFVAQSYIQLLDEAKCTDTVQIDLPQTSTPPPQMPR